MILRCKTYFLFEKLALLTICFSFLFISCYKDKPNSDDITRDDEPSFNTKQTTEPPVTETWQAPDTSSLSHDAAGNLIRYGKDLIVRTAFYLGPKGKVSHFANGLNCQNCHIDAGTKLYANSFSAVYSIYPKFRPRSGTIENLERRINDCMERSMNGRKLDSLSKEMRAMVAYINWVGKDVKKGITPIGASVVDVPLLDRAADKEKGKIAYTRHCDSCHGENGAGMLKPDGVSYIYPPLWGPQSYNTAAGMYRLSRFAGFIKSNMPDQLSNHQRPILTDEQVWDIAAYVNSQSRPRKTFNNDWPDLSKKPIDHPFGPYADPFTETQHKYGPFDEIVEFRQNQINKDAPVKSDNATNDQKNSNLQKLSKNERH